MSKKIKIKKEEVIIYKQLAKITKAFFGIEEDRGFCTFMITLNYGGAGQGFGGYALDKYNKKKDIREGTASGLNLMIEILQLFKVEEFKDLKNRIVYALYDKPDSSWNRVIIGLEVLPFEENGGKRFLISNWQEKWSKKKV